jgi:hypothetical protein|tara:strand:- start:53 stop:373 length:321 start_codon:yes stop_codon:yes gene_type:complete
MVLSFTNGNVTTNGTEQTVWNITADKHFAGWLFLNNMGANEVISVRIYVQDTDNSGALKKYIDTSISGSQGTPAFFIPYVPTKQHKVTVQLTAGSNVAVYWQRAEA